MVPVAPAPLVQQPVGPATAPTPMAGGQIPADPAVGAESMVPSETVTFDEALRRARANNSNARIAVDEIARAEALVREAQAAWLPTLTGVGNYTRLDSARVSSPAAGNATLLPANSLNLSVNLTVPLFSPRAWLASKRAKVTADSYRFNEADLQRQIALSTGRAYLTVVAAHRQLQVAARAVTNAKDHDDYDQQRLKGGLGNRLDALRSAQDLATTIANLRNQLVALSRAREALGALLAADAPVDAADIPSLPAPPGLAASLDLAKSRADVLAAEARTKTSDALVNDTWAIYAPVLNGSFQPFYQDPATATVPSTGWAAMLVLTVPFYDGGLRYGQIREYKALASESHELLGAQLRLASSEVRAAFEALVHDDEALDAARSASRLAGQALKLSEDAFHGGAVTSLEVLDAARVMRDVESAEATAEDNSRQARLELLAAAGKL
jgi:outer membrane protein TolC